MVNTYAKGKRIEAKAKAILTSHGYSVEQAKITRWNRNDFFGLFDLIAKNELETRWIQIKTDTVASKVIEDIMSFKAVNGCKTDSFEVWIWKQKKKYFERRMI